MEIVDVQALVSVQDLGRYGLRRLGIGHAGAMDRLALKAGNVLLHNDEGAAALEVVLGSIKIRFQKDTPFCITGALYEAYLDETPVHSYWRYTAKAGQVLHLVRAVQGMYGYLCVYGGVDVGEVLGARSTDLKAGFGGFQGRALQVGDEVATAGEACAMSVVGIAPIHFVNRIHAVMSSEYECFTRQAHYHFWQNAWTLQSDSNRMGYRFRGAELKLSEPTEMLSHAVQFGTVQIPPSGQPIVLMADTQTTGGYPKIATVVEADLGYLAQIRFGNKVYFQAASVEQAKQLQQRNQVYLRQIAKIAAQSQ